MGDYHVDRPEVEAPQGVELTGTNRSDILTNIYAHQNAFMYAALEVLLYVAFLRHRLELRLGVTEGSSFWRS